jgi:hypothetical protein
MSYIRTSGIFIRCGYRTYHLKPNIHGMWSKSIIVTKMVLRVSEYVVMSTVYNENIFYLINLLSAKFWIDTICVWKVGGRGVDDRIIQFNVLKLFINTIIIIIIILHLVKYYNIVFMFSFGIFWLRKLNHYIIISHIGRMRITPTASVMCRRGK